MPVNRVSGSDVSSAHGEDEPTVSYFGDPKKSEKVVDIENSVTTDSQEEDEEDLPPDVLELPRVVRDVVPLEDDPSIPIFTFRYVVLSIIFVAPGAFISTMNSFRTTSAAYSIFFVQICSHWLGKWLAKALPNKTITPFGKKQLAFNLNPGPWSIKECSLVSITASSGATGSLATNSFALGSLYFNTEVQPAVALFFMWAIVTVGYSYAALARNFLVYDPQFVWPQSLMQTALLQSFKKSDNDSALGRKQVKAFFFTLLGATVWQFFPEYIFPMTSSLAFLCWVAPTNPTANFIGSGLGGMGFLNLTLDWSNITSSIMLSPYWVQVVQFAGFVFGAWILLPAAKWSNLTSFKAGLMSNSLFTSEGERYPTELLSTSNAHFNATAYAQYGPVHLGAQRAWNMFFDYAAYISGITWVILFGLGGLKESFKKVVANIKAQRERKRSGVKATNIHHQYTDRINKLQAHYEEVPLYWYGLLFIASFIVLITVTATGSIPLPWWSVVVALGIGVVIVVPLAWLYAISNFQLAIGTFNELLFGYMIQSQSQRNGMSANLYGCISGDVWYRAQYMLQDLSLGARMQLKPKLVFFSQLFGILISCPINYACMRWILSTKREFLDGSKVDPMGQWTGQTIVSYHTDAVQYVILGPTKLFKNYPMLPYGFLTGLIVPLVLFGLHKAFPRSRLQFNLWNSTVFFSTLATFYGNISTGYLSKFIGGTIVMYWVYNYKHTLWKTYNYIVAASLDTAYSLAVLLIFLFFTVFPGRVVNFPNWWGNNAVSVERCFAPSD